MLNSRRAKSFSWSSEVWELVEKKYKIGQHYEFDDGVKVGDTYYIYEEGIVYTYQGDLAQSSGRWKASGTFPSRNVMTSGFTKTESFISWRAWVFSPWSGQHGGPPHLQDWLGRLENDQPKAVTRIRMVVTNMAWAMPVARSTVNTSSTATRIERSPTK